MGSLCIGRTHVDEWSRRSEAVVQVACFMNVLDVLSAACAELESFRRGLPKECDATRLAALMASHDKLADQLQSQINVAEAELARLDNEPDSHVKRPLLREAIQRAKAVRENGFIRPGIHRQTGRGR